MAKQKSPTKKPVVDSEGQEPEGTEPDGDGEGDGEGDDSEDENRRINAIVTNRVKREMKGVLSALAQMQESLKALSATPKKPEGDDAEGDDEEPEVKKPEVDVKTSKRMTRLEKELAEQKARAEKAERERAEESEKARRNEMRNAFQAALQEHGVTDPRLMRAALDQLEQDGFMIRDEDNKIKFKGQDKYGIDTNFDPKVGLKTWIQTEGKSFVPAVDAGGSGSGGSRNTGSQGKGEFSKLSPAQKAAIEIDRASQGLPPLE